MGNIQLRQVMPDHADLAALIQKLDADLLNRYPEGEIFGLNFDDPKINEVEFLVAYSDEVPVGCGAIRPLDHESTELKRFFVEQAFRQQGIAKQILIELETRAKELGFKSIKLEAGAPQPEAIRFYKKHGYYEIDRYGEYVTCESSLCYEKRILEGV
ncbi:N-acetyltransferase [Paenibacillus baekrokdamisoli]|uniref:N-acetyltransferase n=1 Tax=Paenibacillus baekrokdamisoli TaxID=1712516 RepID=A0A3G9J7V4_9BACL|nr:GNAT family N-acetyltransferase [Paenibacillus baekrokdamisoli]MBB3067469.1 GNAT superfamily N-acetyltransferase [Paenibacillus baekrokdamisoli]BBH19344.1 N-acetyltransferase [Paenibacillus baekrokdamisoli]